MKQLIILTTLLIGINSCQQRKSLINIRNLEVIEGTTQEAEAKEISTHSTAPLTMENTAIEKVTKQTSEEQITAPVNEITEMNGLTSNYQSENPHFNNQNDVTEDQTIAPFYPVVPLTLSDSTESKKKDKKLTKKQSKIIMGTATGAIALTMLVVIGVTLLGVVLLIIVFVALINAFVF